MPNENSKIDGNSRHTILGVTNDANAFIKNLLVDPTTGALLCSSVGSLSTFADGAVGAPSIAFTTDTTCGFYHTGTGATGSILAAINGVKKLELTASIIKTTGISVVVGAAALATSATDGFLYVPTSAGTPTGVPTAQTGTTAIEYDTTNHRLAVYDGGWDKVVTGKLGGFYAYGKAIAFNITVADTYHAFCLKTAGDLTTGSLVGFTENDGRVVDSNITSEANGTGGKLRVICSVAHGLTTGDLVVLGNMNNAGHNKPTHITTDGTNPTTEFLCDDITYVSGAGASAGTVTMPAFLQASTGSSGIFWAGFNIVGTASNANKDWKWELNINITPADNVVSERRTTGTLASMTASGHITIADGDRIWISAKNSTDTTDYTIKDMNLNLHKVY